MTVSSAELVSFLVYLIALAAIAMVAWRRTRDLDDYTLGGRTLGPIVAALSAGASDMSGWLLLGLPGAIFVGGLSQSWIVIGLVVGAFLNWTLIAPRLRTMSAARHGARTLPQLFALRFPRRGRALALIATVMILLFFGLYTAAGFVAGAKLFNASLGLDYQQALWLGAATIMVYTALGGFLAVSWTDVMQGSLMVAALVAVPLLALDAIDTDVAISHLSLFEGMTTLGIASLLAWGLGYFGQPHILARFMAMSPDASIDRATAIGMGWMIVSCAGAIAVGIVGFAHGANGAAPLDPEIVFIHLTRAVLSPWVSGFVLAAILAAVMSTIDSQLLVASTSLTEDVARPLWPGLTEVQMMRISRLAVIVVAGAGIWIAGNPERGVLELVGYAWAGLGATFGPALLATLYMRRATSMAIVAGMVAGGAVVVGWPLIIGDALPVYELLPAFLASGMTIVLVTQFAPEEATAADAFDRLSSPRPSKASSRSG